MEFVATERESLQKLVKRDLILVSVGSVIAIWTYSIVAAQALGAVSELTAGRIEVAVAVVLSCACVWWWASGPKGLMKDRVLVLIPVFLIAGPGLLGVHNLGGDLIVAALSGAVGFAAACALGLMWSGRKRGRTSA